MKLRLAPLAALAVCSLGLGACSTIHNMHMPHVWPFYKKPKAGPQAVHELNLVNADGSEAGFPQYWKRNTLIIDLSGVSGSGNVAARLPDQTTWPVRVAVRVRPGSVQEIEVLGEERNVLAVTPDGVDPIDLQLASSVYRPTTAAIYISWGSMAPAVEGPAAAPATPVFVSPTEVPKSESSAKEIVPPAEVAPSSTAPAQPAQPSPPGN